MSWGTAHTRSGAAGCERGARALGVRALRELPYEQLPEVLAGLAA